MSQKMQKMNSQQGPSQGGVPPQPQQLQNQPPQSMNQMNPQQRIQIQGGGNPAGQQMPGMHPQGGAPLINAQMQQQMAQRKAGSLLSNDATAQPQDQQNDQSVSSQAQLQQQMRQPPPPQHGQPMPPQQQMMMQMPVNGQHPQQPPPGYPMHPNQPILQRGGSLQQYPPQGMPGQPPAGGAPGQPQQMMSGPQAQYRGPPMPPYGQNGQPQSGPLHPQMHQMPVMAPGMPHPGAPGPAGYPIPYPQQPRHYPIPANRTQQDAFDISVQSQKTNKLAINKQLYVYHLNQQLYKTEYAGLQIEMPKNILSSIQKCYDYHLTKMGATDKMVFLENTLLKRKSLIVASSASKKRQQKAAQKRLKKSMKRNQGIQTQCPVYKCFRECKDEEGLLKHYNEAHGDLKALGLELFPDPHHSSGFGSGNQAIKGKVSNQLLTQVMIIALQNKQQVKDIMKQLNDEVPVPE